MVGQTSVITDPTVRDPPKILQEYYKKKEKAPRGYSTDIASSDFGGCRRENMAREKNYGPSHEVPSGPQQQLQANETDPNPGADDVQAQST